MTKLFEDDAYLKEFKAKIIDIVKEDNRIELNHTAFYAKSGGQPGDTGTIEIEDAKIQVLDTVKENNKIINIVDDIKDLEENSDIIGKINWDLRYKHMRMHTALHLYLKSQFIFPIMSAFSSRSLRSSTIFIILLFSLIVSKTCIFILSASIAPVSPG